MYGRLRLGFFPGWGGQDSLLMMGDSRALTSLAVAFTGLATGDADRVQLDSLPFVEAQPEVALLAERTNRSWGVRRSGAARYSFRWQLRDEDWDNVVQLLGPISEGGGHQYPTWYLGTQDDVQVIVSSGEYTDRWWSEHGTHPP